MMKRNIHQPLLLLILIPGWAHASSVFPSLTAPIRKEIQSIETELASLPIFPVNTSPWTMGYTSEQHREPQWPVEINLKFVETAEVDLVVLMPTSYTDQQNQIQPWGFPVRFTIERILKDGSRELVADYRDRDYPVSGIDPQMFPVPDPQPTIGLRVVVFQAPENPTWWRAKRLVSLSEVYAFAGPQNAALGARVRANSSMEYGSLWSQKCLTDGFTLFSPLFHDLDNPENSIVGMGLRELSVELDLGKVSRVDEFRLWPVVHNVQHNYPLSNGIGFPFSIRLEASLSPDFDPAEVIYDSDRPEQRLNYRPAGGPFMTRIRPTQARYLRFVFADGFPDFIRYPRKPYDRIALSEIEVLSHGANISRGAPVRSPGWGGDWQTLRLANLTDGRSNEGEILPLRQWLDQFKQRVQLEAKLKMLRHDLDEAQQKEARRFRTLILVAIVLIALLLQLLWLARAAARRRAAQMRERIACDLHDEIGANVSSMAHTAELLEETIDQPSTTQARLLGNLVDSARLTARETKHFIQFIEGENRSYDITEQFTKVADRILGTIPTTFSFENTRSFNALDPVAKWNLLLFYKETLNNIIKHAQATAVTIRTRREDNQLILEVSDNGRGIPKQSTSCRHLEQRAAMLGGRLDIESQLDEGTRITLHFKARRKS
jgi:signal transduction histidine kinase